MKKKTIEETYKKLNHREFALTRPDSYIGGIQSDKRFIFTVNDINDLDNIKIVKKEIEYNAGLIKIFDEILVNASDHCIRTGKVKVIKVEIENNIISVYNDGDGIPVQIHKDEKCYIPELIFGHLLAGSNFDDNEERIVGGRNGLGATICNIFSKEFIVETADGKNYYKQKFVDNLSTDKKGKLPKPSIRESNKNFTKITFTPDYERFGYTTLTDDIKSVMIKRVIDIASYNPTVKVYFNNKLIPVKSFKDYVKLFVDAEQEVFSEKLNDNIEITLTKTNYDGFEQNSLVNGIATIEGGTHIQVIINDITNKLKTALSKGNKYNINPVDIKNKLFLFVNSKIVNPEFTAQTKEVLSSKSSIFYKDIEVSENLIKKILKSSITQEIVDYIEMKEQLALKKATKSSTKVKIKALDDANKAGGKDSNRCHLFVTEGLSAKSNCISGFSVVGRDYYGCYPVRGKGLNVKKASIVDIKNNEEIKNIISALGLEIGKKYESLNELRYGKLVLFADSDSDGYHIEALLLSFFHTMFKSLLELDFLYQFITPIVKATKGNIVKYFYKITDYNKFKLTDEYKNYKIVYFKGVGSLSPAETKNLFKSIDKHLIKFNYSEPEQTDNTFSLLFDKGREDDRKEWLKTYIPNNIIDKFNRKTTYLNFLNDEFIEFSMEDNVRSIPSVIDGLKPVQRKIIYTFLDKNLISDYKVSQITGSIIEHSSYHHGPVALEKSIVGLNQRFVGFNNISLLTPTDGNFGCRLQPDNFAAPRYIFTKLNNLTKYIYLKEDTYFLDYLNDDGFKIEPKFYLPVVPVVMITNSQGIGTGFSTNIPQFNLLDIIQYLQNKLDEKKKNIELNPYYNDFKGTITFQDGKYITKGVIENINDTTIRIKELPIGMWTNDYYEILDKLYEDKVIKDYNKYCTDEVVDIEVILSKEILDNLITTNTLYNKFKLETVINLTNIHAFDEEQKIRKYNNQYEVINYFYDVRIKYYQKRKDYIIEKIKYDILIIDNKVKFISCIINKDIVINNRAKEEIILDIEKNNLVKIDNSYEYLLNLPVFALSSNNIFDLEEKLNKKNGELLDISNQDIKDMWREDLKNLKKEYNKILK